MAVCVGMCICGLCVAERVLTMLERGRFQSNSIDLRVCVAEAREEVAIAGLPASSAVPGSHSSTACEGSAYGRDHASLCWGSVCEEWEASMSCWSPPGTSWIHGLLPDHCLPDECASEWALELNPEELKKKRKKIFKANLERVRENMLFVNYYYYSTFWKLSKISICTKPGRVSCYCTFFRAGVFGLSPGQSRSNICSEYRWLVSLRNVIHLFHPKSTRSTITITLIPGKTMASFYSSK